MSSYLELLYYIVWVIKHCVELYFLTFYLLFSQCVNLINKLVSEYFIVFDDLFKYSTTYPQIMWFPAIIGLTYLFVLGFFKILVSI